MEDMCVIEAKSRLSTHLRDQHGNCEQGLVDLVLQYRPFDFWLFDFEVRRAWTADRVLLYKQLKSLFKYTHPETGETSLRALHLVVGFAPELARFHKPYAPMHKVGKTA